LAINGYVVGDQYVITCVNVYFSLIAYNSVIR